jgi:hypothetical protein
MTSAAYRKNFKLIDFSKPIKSQPRRALIEPQRSNLPCPQLMRNTHVAGQSQLDGKMYDTKEGLLRSYKDYEARTGKRVEIVGDQTEYLKRENSKAEVADEKQIDKSIKDALEKVGA